MCRCGGGRLSGRRAEVVILHGREITDKEEALSNVGMELFSRIWAFLFPIFEFCPFNVTFVLLFLQPQNESLIHRFLSPGRSSASSHRRQVLNCEMSYEFMPPLSYWSGNTSQQQTGSPNHSFFFLYQAAILLKPSSFNAFECLLTKQCNCYEELDRYRNRGLVYRLDDWRKQQNGSFFKSSAA